MSDDRTDVRRLHVIKPDAVSVPGNRFQEAWPDELREQLRDIYLTVGNRNATRTLQYYRELVGPDTPLPSASTVRNWVGRFNWASVPVSEARARRVARVRARWDDAQELALETFINNMEIGLEVDATWQDRMSLARTPRSM